MRPVLWLIGGTSEGRSLIKELAGYPIDLYVSVATDYGASLIEAQDNVTVMAERMDLAAMRAFLKEHKPLYTIDATHPYATIVTATVQEACEAENCQYLRLVRPAAEGGDYITVADFQEAVELLNSVEGNIFLTTGSKNLPDFTGVTNYAERIALRVLPCKSKCTTTKMWVCFSNNATQCGFCVKCLRTQLNILCAKGNPKDWGFDNFSQNKFSRYIKAYKYHENNPCWLWDNIETIQDDMIYPFCNDLLHWLKSVGYKEYQIRAEKRAKQTILKKLISFKNYPHYFKVLITKLN